MRRQLGNTAPAISLFPFLAVLLCTMGALIVVLVVLNRQSRLRAATLSAADGDARRIVAKQAQADEELRRDALAWQLEHLRVSREKTQADLNAERLRLSGVEQHRRQLETQLTELQQAAGRLETIQSSNSTAAYGTNELAKFDAAIHAARQRLANVGQHVGGQAPAYSVVPYDGPNRTRRRPIYIECADDRVIIQPEGIVLKASDFDAPLGPGNPLASAIRAARDQIVSAALDPKAADAEPYPLFLVRPDGIEAYYAARAAMASWGSDFGYQTIDQDWKLEYPAADTHLAEAEAKAVEEARQRLRWLAQMSPERYGAGSQRRSSASKVSYRVSPLGGLIREGNPTLRDNAFGASRSGRSASAGGVSPGNRLLANDRAGTPADDRPAAGATRLGAPPASEGAKDSLVQNHEMPKRANEARGGASKAESSAESPATPSQSADMQSNPKTDVGADASSPPAHSRRYGDLNDHAASGARNAVPSDAEGSAKADPQAGTPELSANVDGKSKDAPRSLAQSRGVNWGLSPAARASNPITRPIHIVCEGDKLAIQPPRAGDPPLVIPLRLRTEDSVDSLVAAVQERIKDWGIAGRGMYWRPQLVLEVGRSGEGRYADIEALMADSGFDVKRRE